METQRQLIRSLYIFLFLSPLLVLGFYLEASWSLKLSDVLQYFFQSLVQASLSTFFIAVFGFLFCIGLLGMKSAKKKKVVMALSVLPAFAPTIFIVMSFQLWLNFINVHDADGILLVSFIHGIMNLGLAGTLFYFLIEQGLRKQASLAYLEGANSFNIILHLFRARSKEFLVFLVSMFGLCFTSFAIPMILGGKSGGTLEILAYKQLNESGDLTGAFALMFLQWICFYLLIQPLSKGIKMNFQTGFGIPSAIGKSAFTILGLFAFVISLGGMFMGVGKGMTQFIELFNTHFPVMSLWLNSISLSLFAAGISLVLYLTLSYLWVDAKLNKFTVGFGSVSSVMLGLGLFVMPLPNTIKLGIGLSILFFPLAYRLFGLTSLNALTRQCEVAELMGSTRLQRFQTIIFPQVLPSALRLAGVVSFWTIGEYAMSSVVTGELFNLGLLAKSFMMGYRLELATILNWIILLSGGALFLIFLWSADVCRRKLEI